MHELGLQRPQQFGYSPATNTAYAVRYSSSDLAGSGDRKNKANRASRKSNSSSGGSRNAANNSYRKELEAQMYPDRSDVAMRHVDVTASLDSTVIAMPAQDGVDSLASDDVRLGMKKPRASEAL